MVQEPPFPMHTYIHDGAFEPVFLFSRLFMHIYVLLNFAGKGYV